MKRLFCTFVFFIFLVSSAFSQISRTQYPSEVDGSPLSTSPDTTYINVAGGSSAIFEFHFSGSSSSSRRNSYSGFEAVYCFFDTNATADGDGQGVRIYARPLIYDPVSSDYEHIALPNSTAADSVNIVNNANWQTNHTDSTYSFSKVLNFAVSDGLYIVAAADSSNAPYRIRIILKKAVDPVF